MTEKIPERNERKKEDTWALEDLFPTDDAWEAALSGFAARCETIPAYRGRLGASVQVLLEYLRLQDLLSVECDALANYAQRKSDEDTRKSEYQAMTAKLDAVCTRAGELSDFELPELTAIPDKTLAEFYAQCPELRLYERHLYCIRRLRKYTLSAAEEKLLASAGELSQLPSTLFGRFSNADLQFADAADGAGEAHPVTQGTYITLLQDTDRALRESAYHNYYAQYLQFRNTMAAALYGQVKAQWFYTKARGYASPLEKSLYQNEIPTEVYRNLIAVVRKNQPVMARYLKLRKKLLKLSELHFYDLYAPLFPEENAKEISYDDAVKTVQAALRPLGETYGEILRKGFQGRWIDKYENRGKRSGAYSAGARVHPYVLLNYTPDLDGMFTIAHEMGHAMHSYFSNETQPVVYSDYKIFVAEVASTCNESLLMQHLLKTAKSKQEKLRLMNHFSEQFRATLFRQTMFAEFELQISEAEGEGKPLTAETLQAMYRQLLRDYFGDDVVYDEEITMEWARIPHFYYQFYVYQYATGYAAAIALSDRILKGGEAVSDYLRFLSGGCSKPPIELLKDAGVDMAQPKPVEDAIGLFASLVDEMEKLTEEE